MRSMAEPISAERTHYRQESVELNACTNRRARCARTDGVAAHVKPAEFLGNGTGEPDDSFLCCRIVCSKDTAETGFGAGVNDDSAPLLAHDRTGKPDSAEGTFQMHRHHAVPVVFSEFIDWDEIGNTRVVDDDIQTAERVECGLHQARGALK